MSDTDIRGEKRYNGGGNVRAIVGMDEGNSLYVAQGAPEYLETARRGDGWTVQTATLFAPLTAIPTTTAILELYNNGSRLIVVRDLFAMQVLATAVVQTFAIYAMVTTTKAVPSLTALSIHSTNGQNLITPTAAGELVTGVGTTVVANGWRPYGVVQAWGLAAATPGNSWSVDINGKIIVPPACSVCLHVAGSLATASSFQVGLSFDMVSATVEP